ncbi:hypothetical protein SAMN05421777_10945 [Fluoribacter gormanii]|uniref:Uncharacterized protein n=1 Tax=Fluoribacter gormanii TaxID=464 RepID=A0A377GHK8_9GAMM|nr:hypothetical protein SAMN05421777_10945 [Fluoribacter gormanii]STO24033.1 Uncharacterised protein [Fluoribacter gormanii]
MRRLVSSNSLSAILLTLFIILTFSSVLIGRTKNSSLISKVKNKIS